MEKIKGTLSRIIFSNEENHYKILLVDTPEGPVVTLGTLFSVTLGETIAASGTYVDNPRYGRQFKAESFEVEAPTDENALRAFLVSRLVSGVGEVIAERMLAMFGEGILDVIENRPSELTAVKGIGKKMAESIHDSFTAAALERNTVMELAAFGISVNTAIKLFEKYGVSAANQVKRDPYRLIRDISGIGFAKADEIAAKLGVARDGPSRIRAGLGYYLRLLLQSGHCYAPEEALLSQACQLLSLDASVVAPQILAASAEGLIAGQDIGGNRVYYLPYILDCEDRSAKAIGRLLARGNSCDSETANRLIERFERVSGTTLQDQQRKAVFWAASKPLCIVTGGPGTGKTTIVNAIAFLLRQMGRTFALCAPTGRAAKRMGQASGEDARTIHRLLGFNYSGDDGIDDTMDTQDSQSGQGSQEQQKFRHNKDNPLEEDVIVVDESSMMDITLFARLLDAVDTSRTSLVFVGDKDQLPAVGPGNVLSDMIASGEIPSVRLTRIFRQQEGSSLVSFAHAINRGEIPEMGTSPEVVFIHERGPAQIRRRLEAIMRDNEWGAADMLKSDRLQILCPLKKGEAGVNNINLVLQQTVNPPSGQRAEAKVFDGTFRVGDRVIQMKNDYSRAWTNDITKEEGQGVFNGDIGTVIGFDTIRREMLVFFDAERLAKYPYNQMDSLSLAYAITVHKSQGSEFEAVILTLFNSMPDFLSRNLLYTAVTRAKKRVILLGEISVFRHMVHNNRISHRMSGLMEKIQAAIREGKQ